MTTVVVGSATQSVVYGLATLTNTCDLGES